MTTEKMQGRKRIDSVSDVMGTSEPYYEPCRYSTTVVVTAATIRNSNLKPTNFVVLTLLGDVNGSR